jgi:hypothetical protein
MTFEQSWLYDYILRMTDRIYLRKPSKVEPFYFSVSQPNGQADLFTTYNDPDNFLYFGDLHFSWTAEIPGGANSAIAYAMLNDTRVARFSNQLLGTYLDNMVRDDNYQCVQQIFFNGFESPTQVAFETVGLMVSFFGFQISVR